MRSSPEERSRRPDSRARALQAGTVGESTGAAVERKGTTMKLPVRVDASMCLQMSAVRAHGVASANLRS